MTRPRLTVVIGANGAGKTTWAREHRDTLPRPFYNADSIAEGLGDANAPALQRTARELVDQQIESDLADQRSFGFESTYSGRSRPEIVKRAKALGYATGAVFHGPCVREERPTDISQYYGADRMKLRYARVCASQRRSRRKTPHFNLLRNPEPTTTPAGRVVLTVFAGVAQFERSLIGIRTEEGRRTAQARDVPFERPSKLRPDQRILARQLIEQEGQSVSEVAQPTISMPQRFFAAPRSGDLMTVHRSSRTHGPNPEIAATDKQVDEE